MPTGLKVQVRTNTLGRAAVEKDESANTLKNLILAFSEGGDKNPFQDLGLDLRLIFSLKNPEFRGRANIAVRKIINKYSDLVALDESIPIEFDDSVEGEVNMSFRYIDLLTGKRSEFVQTFRRA